MSSRWCHSLEIKGALSWFFPLNADITEKIARTIIGLPIHDADGKTIGIVEDINWETGEWYGRILVEANIRDEILRNVEQSMRIVGREKQ